MALQGEGSGQQPRDRRCRADVAHLTRGRGRELERLDRIGQAARVEEDGALDPLGEVRLVPQLLRDRDHIGDCRDRGVSLAALGEQRRGVGQVVGPDGPPEPRRPLLARPQEVGYSAPPPQQEHHAGHRPERLQPRRSHPLSQLEHPLGRRPGLCAAKHRVPFPDRGEVPEPGRLAAAAGPVGVHGAPPGAGGRRLLLADADVGAGRDRDHPPEGVADELARWHEAFADWLEALAGERVGEYEELLGHHLAEAARYRLDIGDHGTETQVLARRAATLCRQVADRSAAQADFMAAAGLLRRVAALLPADDPSRPIAIADCAGWLLTRVTATL